MLTTLFLSLNLEIGYYIASADPVPLAVVAAAAINHSSGEWPIPGTSNETKSSGPPLDALAVVAYTFYRGRTQRKWI